MNLLVSFLIVGAFGPPMVGAFSIPSKVGNGHKLQVLLDVHNTLMNIQYDKNGPNGYGYHDQEERGGFSIEKYPVEYLKLCQGNLLVSLRPGVREFMDKVTKRFDTHIITGGMSGFLDEVCDELDPNNQLAGRHSHFGRQLSASHCFTSPRIQRTVLVDNRPSCHDHDPENGILIPSFYGHPNDTSLESVWDLLLELESDEGDVRPVLKDKFGLREAIKGYGLGDSIDSSAYVAWDADWCQKRSFEYLR